MARRQFVLTLLVCLTLALPAATASFRAYGEEEPNSAHDTDRFNRFDVDDAAFGGLSYAYFNVFITESATSFNTNVGALQTQISTAPNYNFEAAFGVWKDCNKDGYIGMAETAVHEYRAELLTDTSVCPAGLSAHNDGQWIVELLMFGAVDPCEYANAETEIEGCTEDDGSYDGFFANPSVIYANGTRIWGDAAYPGEVTGSGFCPLGVLPHGTTANTGMMIRYVDCFIGKRITNTVNAVDSDGSLGLRFDNPNEPQQGPSLLSQDLPVNLFGNPFNGQTGLVEDDSDDPAYTAWDCSAEPTYQQTDPTGGALRGIGVTDSTGLVPDTIADPTGEFGEFETKDDDGHILTHVNLADENGVVYTVPGTGSGLGNPTGSYSDSLVILYDGLVGDCDPETSNGASGLGNFLTPEGDNEPSSAFRKESDWVMTFFDGARGPLCLRETDCQLLEDNLGANTPLDFGVTYGREVFAGPNWGSSGVVTTGQNIGRTTLEPHSRFYFSWYAQVDLGLMTSLGIALPEGGGIYGDEHCSVIAPGAGNENGFVCDPELWWLDSTGKDTMPRAQDGDDTKLGTPLGVSVGAPYTFRDVDCYDGRVQPGVYASLTPMSAKGTCDSGF